MPKVDPIGTRIKGVTGTTHKRKVATEAVGGATAYQAGEIPDHILALITDIEESGQELKRDPTGNSLEQYRKAVTLFLDAALADSMKVSSEASLGLSRKVFSTIARVDIALADLTDAVLGRQKDLLKIEAIVNQVKGLVVDLYS